MSFWRQSFWSGLHRGAGSVIALAISIITARLLGANDLGVLAAIIAVIAIFSRTLSFGLTQAAQYFGALDVSQGDSHLVNLATLSLATAVISSLIILIFQINYEVWGYLSVKRESDFYVLVYIIPVSIMQIHASLYILGRKEISEYAAISIVPLLVSFATICIFGAMGFGKITIIYSVIFQNIAAFGLSIFYIYRVNPKISHFSYQKQRSIIKYSIKSYITSTVGFFSGQIVIFMGALFAGHKSVGILSVSLTFSNALMLIYGSVGPLLFSHIAGIENSKDKVKFLMELSPIILIIFCASALILGIASPFVVPLAFGSEFTESGWVVLVLLPGIICSSMQRTFENYLFGRSLQGRMTWVHIGSLSTIFICLYLLGDKLGAYGLALSMSIGYSFAMIFTAFLIKNADQIAISSLLIPKRSDFINVCRLLRRVVRK